MIDRVEKNVVMVLGEEVPLFELGFGRATSGCCANKGKVKDRNEKEGYVYGTVS